MVQQNVEPKPIIHFPDMASDYPISAEQAGAFGRDGHILLRGVANKEELSVYGPAIQNAVKRLNHETRPLEARDTYGKAFIQIGNLWDRDENVKRFTLARRFAKIAAELMGVDGVRIYHDQALFKEAHGGHTPWHQDQFYWPLDTDKTITMWMPLVDCSADMGSMTFASGSHKNGYLGEIEISDKSEAVFEKYVAENGFSKTNVGAMAAGDATFHTGWTLHCAPGNNTNRTRAVMTIIYFADGVRVLRPDHRSRECDLAAWLPGTQPGEIAATRLNPLVYKR